MALFKNYASVSYVFCQCYAGKVGLCFHILAVMKLVAKSSIDKLSKKQEKDLALGICHW